MKLEWVKDRIRNYIKQLFNMYIILETFKIKGKTPI